jgi:hypothetical protein
VVLEIPRPSQTFFRWVQPYLTDSATPNRQLKQHDLTKLADSLTITDQPTLLYFLFFSTAHFSSIFCRHTFGTFGFARHTNQRFAKPKEPNFPPHH